MVITTKFDIGDKVKIKGKDFVYKVKKIEIDENSQVGYWIQSDTSPLCGAKPEMLTEGV
jgi:hypothetical protein